MKIRSNFSKLDPMALIALADLAELSDSTKAATYKIIDRGHGPAPFRVGRRIMFRVGDVRSWLQGAEHPAEPVEHLVKTGRPRSPSTK